MIEKIAKKILLQTIACNIVKAELTKQQKKQVDWYARWRDESLTFGQMFNSERTYFSIGASTLSTIEIPDQIQKIIDKEGYYCPDYRKGYVYKKNDKLKNKPVKLIKILNKGESDKDKFNQLKKQFDERLSTSRKQNIPCEICITHNPYDIAGMSTDRNWSSCMNLDGGAYSETPLKQVQYGGMCAYLIKKGDRNIEQPIARIAIKRLISDDSDFNFMFIAEDTIYGDVGFANDLKFMKQVVDILNKSNKKTMNNSKIFVRDDEDSYSDSDIKYFLNFKDTKELLNFVKDDPSIINENGFLDTLTSFQLYLLFDYLIEFCNTKYLLALFRENQLNSDEVNQMVDCFIKKSEFFRMKLFLYENKGFDEARKRVINFLIKRQKDDYLIELINRECLTSYQIEFVVNNIVNQGSLFQLKDFLIDLNRYLSLELKNKIINKLIELKEYSFLFSLISQGYIDKNNINLIAEHIINLHEQERDIFTLSELFIHGNKKLTEENKQKIKNLILSNGNQSNLYDLLDENKLSLEQQVMATKKMIDNGYYVEAYEHIFGLIKDNKFDKRIKNDVLDIIIEDVKQRYDNGQVNNFYLNEIEEIANSLK